MTGPIKPREVEKPFLRRWLRVSLQLFGRAPMRFGLLIAVLAWFDTSAVKLADGYAVSKTWVDRLGILLLPVLWTVVSAVARGADDDRRTWEALSSLRRRPVWFGAFSTGATILVVQWIIDRLFGGLLPSKPHSPDLYLQHPGQLIESIAAKVVITSLYVGLCYFPLLVFIPDLSPREARQLSKRAERMNGELLAVTFVGITAIAFFALESVAPAYGITAAAFLVFLGVFNFVVFRDIFERQDGNLPRTAVVAPAPADASQTS